MIRKSRWNTGVSALVALVAVFVMACRPAQAQLTPFVISGTGVGPFGLPLPGQPARPHWAKGTATNLGQYYGEGSVETDSANFNADGTITGEFGSGEPFVFSDANGDTLVCEYGRVDFGATRPGTFTLFPLPEFGPGVFMAVFVADFDPVAGKSTGKFVGVSGHWKMIAVSAPFVLGSSDPLGYEWNGKGFLTLKQGR